MEPILKVIRELRDRYGDDDVSIFIKRLGGEGIDDASILRTIWAKMRSELDAFIIDDCRQSENRCNRRQYGPL